MNKLDIEVGDRVTYIERKIVIVDGDSPFSSDFGTKEVKNKVTEVVTRCNKEYKDILKIERIGQNGWHTVYEKESEILDEKEKEYLNNVIKPFKNRVQSIMKENAIQLNPLEFKTILNEQIVIQIIGDYIYLPTFKNNTMYKNMETNKKYTLKELGLE